LLWIGAGFAGATLLLRVIVVPQQRWIWLPLALGVSFFAVGAAMWVLWFERLDPPPYPALSDVFLLAIYPLGFLSAMLVLRAQIGRIGMSVWLDGLIAFLATASITGALVVGPLTQGAVGSATAVIVTLAYPLSDLLLVGVVVGSCVMTKWRPGAAFILLGLGFLAYGGADMVYLKGVVTAGAYSVSLVPNLGWLVGVVFLATAAWRPIPALGGREAMGRLAEVLPTILAVTAVALLVLDRFRPLAPVTLGLAIATVLVALTRLARSAREERLLHESRRQANTDELTGLPNRRALTAAAEAVLSSSSPQPAALLLIDLNGFKELNDTLGHAAGDLLLKEVGRRMGTYLRPDDLLVRLGGDEFAVLLAGCSGPAEAEASALRLLSGMRSPFPILGLQLRTSASIGIACAPLHGTTPSALLARADTAMYRAKSARIGVQLYDGSPDGISPDRLALAGELGRALAEGEIVPYFQPQVDPRTRELVGVEALARWEHPVRGTLPPAAFLAAIEQTNLARELTLTMVEMATGRLAQWAAAGVEVAVSVNLAAANLMDDAFVGDVADILRLHDLRPDQLCLEITEGILMTDPERAGGVLDSIRALGVGLSLDDFGTEHSSLSYLSRLPVNELKIDRSFVRELPRNPRTATIVAATCDLARELGLRSVVEGVEDAETLELVERMGCDSVQGYYVSKPIPGAAFIDWLETWRTASPGGAPRRILP
jgi:diguanylate cyclase (GGDEF)-like protein